MLSTTSMKSSFSLWGLLLVQQGNLCADRRHPRPHRGVDSVYGVASLLQRPESYRTFMGPPSEDCARPATPSLDSARGHCSFAGGLERQCSRADSWTHQDNATPLQGLYSRSWRAQSINQSNFYSANIPSEARLSGVTSKRVFNSKIDEAAS